MVSTISIRPILAHELISYFQIRYKVAQKHNLALISGQQEASKLEIDTFDTRSIHIGAFWEAELIGCIRLVSAQGQTSFALKSQSFLNKRIQEQDAINEMTLPSSKFLEAQDRLKLENHFAGLQASGKTLSEGSRFINLLSDFHPRLLRGMLCYVWAMNLFFEIDYCFLNTTAQHGRYYKTLFNCKDLFPEMSLDTGAQDKKFLLYAEINQPHRKQEENIYKLLDQFRKAEALSTYSLELELLKR